MPAAKAGLQLLRVAVQVAVAGRLVTGSAPVWDITSATLLWVDTVGETVHRFDPGTGRDEALALPQPVVAAHPRRHGGLVLTLRAGVALLDPGGTRRWLVYWGSVRTLGAAAAVDRAGRLWVSTTGEGALLRVQPDGAVQVALHDVELSGIAFSPAADTIYLADAASGYLAAADFDPEAGEIGLRRPLCPAPGGPGALCVDAEGGLWVAPGADTAVHRYRPDGRLDLRVPVGSARPTGCALGGLRLADLYLTAAPPRAPAEPAGPLLLIPDAAEGLPTPVFTG